MNQWSNMVTSPLSREVLEEAIQKFNQMANTPQPLREFRRCQCHGWRTDECPNVGVADLFRLPLAWAADEQGWNDLDQSQ